jgi:hypothetical protein
MITYVCVLKDWIYIRNDEIDMIMDVMAVFLNLKDAIEYSKSYDFQGTQKWIEIYEFNGTQKKEIGEIDGSGFTPTVYM